MVKLLDILQKLRRKKNVEILEEDEHKKYRVDVRIGKPEKGIEFYTPPAEKNSSFYVPDPAKYVNVTKIPIELSIKDTGAGKKDYRYSLVLEVWHERYADYPEKDGIINQFTYLDLEDRLHAEWEAQIYKVVIYGEGPHWKTGKIKRAKRVWDGSEGWLWEKSHDPKDVVKRVREYLGTKIKSFLREEYGVPENALNQLGDPQEAMDLNDTSPNIYRLPVE